MNDDFWKAVNEAHVVAEANSPEWLFYRGMLLGREGMLRAGMDKDWPATVLSCWKRANVREAFAAVRTESAEIARLQRKIDEQDKRLLDYSWQTNPDRMGS